MITLYQVAWVVKFGWIAVILSGIGLVVFSDTKGFRKRFITCRTLFIATTVVWVLSILTVHFGLALPLWDLGLLR